MPDSSARWWIALLLLSGFSFPAGAQQHALDMPVTLHARDTPLQQVLDTLQQQTGLSFSYNPHHLPLKQPVTYEATGRPLRQVLDYLGRTCSFTYQPVEKQLVLLPAGAAKTYALSGYVTDSKTGESLIGAVVLADSLSAGALTNGYGHYTLMLPPGRHRLTTAYIGYQRSTRVVEVPASQTLDFRLIPAPPELEAVLVEGRAPANIELVQTGRVRLLPQQIGQAPAAFGEPDVIKALESVPGINMQSEGSTFFYVRGGGKDENLILIDDAPVYNPTHLLGLFSSITPAAANAIEVYKSDFPLSKAGRLSSVIDIKIREGNRQRLSGWGLLSPVSWQLGVEGPLKKEISSFLVSGRVSAIRWVFDRAIANLDRFRFYDLTAKANFRPHPRHRLFFSFYTGSDSFLTAREGLSWRNLSGSLRWNYQIGKRLLMHTVLYGSNYEYRLHYNRAGNEYWRSRIGEAGLKADFTRFLSGFGELQFGLHLTGRTINPGNLNTPGPVPAELVVSVRNNLETAIYARHQVQLSPRLTAGYGIRLSLWSSLGDAYEYTFNEFGLAVDTTRYAPGRIYHNYFQAEPRLTLSYASGKATSVKFSYGRMVQNLHLISNTISPFSSFEVWLPSGPNIRPRQADQFNLGYYQTWPEAGVEWQAEVFYKLLHNQLDYRDHAATLLNPVIEAELVRGKGYSYGIESMLRKNEGRLRGMLAYTYSRSRSRFAAIDSGRTFNHFADRPHHLNLELSYDLGLRLTLSSHFSFISGLPFSSPTGFYRFNGTEVPVYSQRNNDRLPPYHRLDLALKIVLNKNPHSRFRHSLTFSAYNVYSRKNPIFINFNKIQDSSGRYVVPANLLTAGRLTTQTYLYRFTPAINYQFTF